MTVRAFRLLLAVTLLAVVAAAWAGIVAARRDAGRVVGELALPGFATLADRVARIEVARGSERATLVRGEGAAGSAPWSVAELAGYPARGDPIRALIRAVASLRLVEPRTARPERLARLDLGEPPDGKGTRLVLRDGAGATLADLVIGKRRRSYRDTEELLYVRRGGETQAWLAEGDIALSPDPANWTFRGIVDVPRRQVRRVELRHADGERLVVVPMAQVPGAFTVETVPPGRRVRSFAEVGKVAGALERLVFDEARPAAEIDFGQATATAVFALEGGASVAVEVAERSGAAWLRLVADPGGSTGELRAELASAAARHPGWAYRLSRTTADRFRPRLADLLD